MSQSLFESAVLGACLLDEKAMAWAHRNVQPEHFISTKATKQIFELMNSMYVTGKPVDVITVAGMMTPSQKKNIDLTVLTKAVDDVKNVGTIEHYAELMRKGSISCRLEKLYEQMKLDPSDENAQKEIKRLWDEFAGQVGSGKSMEQAVDAYKVTLERRKNQRDFRIVTGFSKFDEIIGGFYAGYMIALGARTSVGKTTAFLHLAYRFIRQSAPVLFISAEMSCDEMIDRLVSMSMDIKSSVLKQGKISAFEMERLNGKLDEFKALPMVWIEGGRMSLTRMRTAIQTYKPAIVFVDFLQRFTPSNQTIQRAAYFSDLANEIKAVAMEQKLICFAASQFNRLVEMDQREPRLSDFKESGGLEEASDICIAIHPLSDDPTNELRDMDWIIMKHRHGPTGRVRFVFRKPYTQFFEKEEDHGPMGTIRRGKEEAAGDGLGLN